MIGQCRAMTLDCNPQVIAAIKHASVKKLESRSPFLSALDLEFVLDQFKSKDFLPDLRDTLLREKVRNATVQSRGPLLTFQTLAKDLKVLLRAQERLKTFLGTDLRREEDDSARQTLEEYFADKFHTIDRSGESDSINRFRTADEFSSYCYELLFLYLMRTAASKAPITERQLDSLAKRALGGSGSVDADEIEIEAATHWSPNLLDLQDTKEDERHGASLFQDPAAKQLLFYDQLHTSHAPDSAASPAFIARDIVCILLYGAPPSLSSLTPLTRFLPAFVGLTPCNVNRDPIGNSTETNTLGATSIYDSRISTNDWSVLEGDQRTVNHSLVKVVKGKSIPDGSFRGYYDSASSNAPHNHNTQNESLKSRSGVTTHQERLSDALLEHTSAHATAESFRIQPSSVYSASEVIEGSLSTPGGLLPTLSLFHTITQIQNLSRDSAGANESIQSHNPYDTIISSQSATPRGLERESIASSSDNQGPTHSERVASPTSDHMRTGVLQDATARKTAPAFVRFVATLAKPSIYADIMFNEHAIEAFIESQKVIDQASCFFYWQSTGAETNSKKVTFDTTAVIFDTKKLAGAIIQHSVETVFVQSNKLGTTQSASD